MNEIDVEMMWLAIDEAYKGLGRTSPNPSVGAVIVTEDQIVKAHHRKAGTDHAEIAALKQLNMTCPGATLYVTLEPCNHRGKTPACCDSILKAGIKRVVIGTIDENPIVCGDGVRRLESEGVEVVMGVLRGPCRQLNEAFFTHIKTGLPFVTVKCATSLDGKLGYRGRRVQITGEDSMVHSHQLRNHTDAILVGISTVLSDDPMLTTRYLDEHNIHHPTRIILDSFLRIPHEAKVLQDKSAKTIIVSTTQAPSERETMLKELGVTVIRVPATLTGNISLRALLAKLGQMDIVSLLVEGGAKVISSFFRDHLVDKQLVYIAPLLLGGRDNISLFTGSSWLDTDQIKLLDPQTSKLGEDILVEGYIDKGFKAPSPKPIS